MSAVSFQQPFGSSVSSASPKSHLKMTRRGRAVLLVIVAIPLVILALVIGARASSATATHESGHLTSITVGTGQSLWQVATKIAPQSDPRDVIADIMSVNQLDSAAVYPGEKLNIPAQYTK